jgi:hypothetical protein
MDPELRDPDLIPGGRRAFRRGRRRFGRASRRIRRSTRRRLGSHPRGAGGPAEPGRDRPVATQPAAPAADPNLAGGQSPPGPSRPRPRRSATRPVTTASTCRPTPTTGKPSRPSCRWPRRPARPTTTPSSASRSPRTTRASRSTSASASRPRPSPPSGSRGSPRVRRALAPARRQGPGDRDVRRQARRQPVFAEKVQAYADHLENWTTQLARNPMEALGPLVEHVAEKLLEKRFGQQQAVQQAQEIVRRTRTGCTRTDANGRRLVGRREVRAHAPRGPLLHASPDAPGRRRHRRPHPGLAREATAPGRPRRRQRGQERHRGPGRDPAGGAAVVRPNVNPGQAVTPARRSVVPGATEPAGRA